MGAHGQDELCEHCGSPLDDSGLCWSCAGGAFLNGSSPVGTAPLEKSELSRVLRRPVGERAHGAYALSLQQEEGMAHLREEIESLVEQFNASSETKNSVKQSAERNAVKLISHLGPTKAAIASVAQEFLRQGRSMADVSSGIARIHPRMGRLSSLVLEVYPEGDDVDVLVNGRRRVFKSYPEEGLYARLRIPVYAEDDGTVVEILGARLCRGGYDEDRIRLMGPSTFRLVLPERTFELFKVLKDARLSGAITPSEVDARTIARKYSISRLPFTERLLRDAGCLNRVNARYLAILRGRLQDGRGRSPRKLAEEALLEACSSEVPGPQSDLIVSRYRLKPSAMCSLVVLPELDAWQRASG